MHEKLKNSFGPNLNFIENYKHLIIYKYLIS